MTIERKSLTATIESVSDATDDKPFGGFVAIASDSSLDRDGEKLLSSEWKTPLPDHITIDVDHGLSVEKTVGSARPYFSDAGELMIDAKFSSIPRAQEVRTLINEGHIKTVSVAAMVDKSLKSGTPRRELLNVGIVAIPSNRNAQILSSKSVDENRSETINKAAIQFLEVLKAGNAAGSSDGAMIQAIHDASGHLGAACIVVEVPVEAGPEDPSGAEDGVNKGLDTEPELKDAEVELPTLPEGITVEQFNAALEYITSKDPGGEPAGEPQGESPAGEPADEAAAAADVAPAPADSAAEPAAESVAVDVEKRAQRMAMSIWAATQSVSD